MADESRRPTVIRDTLERYADMVMALGSPKQQGFFGEPQLPSRLDLIEKAYRDAVEAKNAQKQEVSIFDALPEEAE